MAAVAAAMAGWSVVYLGAALPSEEIAYAATSCGARMVAISLSYPGDSVGLNDFFKDLRRLLPDDMELVVGGASAGAYADQLAAFDVTIFTELNRFMSLLDQAR
jgi:methylmalonyl-CoA mutase cobalamin-binding subunit